MKILALYPLLPYPSISGAKLRGATVLDVLARTHEVVLASFVARDDDPSRLPEWATYPYFARPPVLALRRSDEVLSIEGKRLRANVPKLPLGIPACLAAFDSPAMWNRIAELGVDGFDAVHIRYASMAPYALALKQTVPHLRLVIDLDDILSALFFSRLELPSSISQVRMFLWELKELVRIYAFERGPLRAFDSVWVCSKIDSSRMAKRLGSNRALVVENVVDAQRLAALDRQETLPALLFIGDFNYSPNSEGAAFFVQKAWPLIRADVADAQLWLVGLNSQTAILQWNGQQGIAVTGAVASVLPYLERATISIAPIFTGSGTRLKILEAMGAGLPVVTTTVGAEGIEAEHGVELLIADTAEDFAKHCVELLQNPSLRHRLAEAGKRLVREKYDLAVMSRAVLACYKHLSATGSNNTSQV